MKHGFVEILWWSAFRQYNQTLQNCATTTDSQFNKIIRFSKSLLHLEEIRRNTVLTLWTNFEILLQDIYFILVQASWMTENGLEYCFRFMSSTFSLSTVSITTNLYSAVFQILLSANNYNGNLVLCSFFMQFSICTVWK